MTGQPVRYAIYWAPPAGSPLAELGEAWLGRNVARDAAIAQPALPGFGRDEIFAATAEPRRYGLHATLKAPFRLGDGRSAGELEETMQRFAATARPAAASPLRLKRIGRFIALVPGADQTAINALAAACVERFDGFRAPPDEAELRRRLAARLTPAQRANIARWGYPYAMAEFRFHVTLTGAIADELAARLEPALAELFAPVLGAPLDIGEIALFVEPAPGAPFQLTRRFALGGGE